MEFNNKKVGLIFTASTGGGHNQAADSLKKQMENDDFEVHVMDVFRENSKFLEYLIEDGYNFISNYVPHLYGSIYKITGNDFSNKHIRKFFLFILKKKLIEVLDQYKPSIVIATHPIFVNLIAELKVEGHTNAACVSVVTDLGVHPFYYHPSIDAYITAMDCTKRQLMAYGISSERIHTYGIPVKHVFYNDAKKPKLMDHPFTILLMGGSLGSKKLYSALKSLVKIKERVKIHVVCGNDEEVYQSILTDFRAVPENIQLDVHGFINNVHELMDEADILISKPGGLTLSEAIHKQLPLIIPFYILGQEEENMEILKNEGLGIHIENIDSLDTVITRYIEHPDLLNKIEIKMKNISNQYSITKISDLCTELILARNLA